MARRRRLQFPGAVYHVMARGNRKSMIVDDDDDRRTFMNTFGEAAGDYHVRVYACCLMGTHYHTLLDTPRGNLSEFIQTVNGEYSKAFNRRHGRVGHTFEQRFESLVVQREKYLRRVARYIALNPVKARLCRDGADWPWSTHRATAGLDAAPAWLHLEWLRWAFRANRLPDAQLSYLEYVRDPGRANVVVRLGGGARHGPLQESRGRIHGAVRRKPADSCRMPTLGTAALGARVRRGRSRPSQP